MSQPAAIEPNGTARLSRPRRLGIYGVGIGLWLSGALWLLFHYYVQVEGSFGSRPHALETWWLRLHGAFGFASLWVLGLLWGVHVAHAWPIRRKRWSGSLLLAGLAWLVVSGYLLYYLGDDVLRTDAALLHWAFGLACPALFLTHRLARRDRAPATRPATSTPPVAGALETVRSR